MSLESIAHIQGQVTGENSKCLQKLGCRCCICSFKMNRLFQSIVADLNNQNDMSRFVELLPKDFPIWIQHTMIPKRKENGDLEYICFYNPKDQGNRLVKQIYKTTSVLNSANYHIYFAKEDTILPKFQLPALIKSRQHQIVYLQNYQPLEIIRSQYQNQVNINQLDIILREWVLKEEQKMGQSYRINQDFLNWVYREYSEEQFFHFLLQIYAKLFRKITGNIIEGGIFFWGIEILGGLGSRVVEGSAKQKYDKSVGLGNRGRLGIKPKLLNVKRLKVKMRENFYSFQQQFEELIHGRIAKVVSTKISSIKNIAYKSRLQNFKNKIRDVYNKEQEEVTKGIQKEKQFQYQHDSDMMARLLIPNLPANMTLRDVLKDEQLFRRVCLKQKPKKSKLVPLKPAMSKSLISKSSKLYDSPVLKSKRGRLLTQPSTE